MTPAYRLFRVKDYRPQTLFHKWRGTRVVPIGKKILAERKRVSNPGGGDQPRFMSGWHFGRTFEEVDHLRTTRFKRPHDLVVCKIMVKDIRPKPRTNVGAWLAREMLIRKDDWSDALVRYYRQMRLSY